MNIGSGSRIQIEQGASAAIFVILAIVAQKHNKIKIHAPKAGIYSTHGV